MSLRQAVAERRPVARCERVGRASRTCGPTRWQNFHRASRSRKTVPVLWHGLPTGRRPWFFGLRLFAEFVADCDVEEIIVAEYVPTFLGSVMKQIACTPNKNFDNDAYEKGVIEPAAKIRKLQEKLGDERPTDQQMREVMALLLIIFETKMVDMEEREDRVRETLERTQCHEVFPDLLPLKPDLESQIAQLGLEPGADFLAEEPAESEAEHSASDEPESGERASQAATASMAAESAGATDIENQPVEAVVVESESEAEPEAEAATDQPQAAAEAASGESEEDAPAEESESVQGAGEALASEQPDEAEPQTETATADVDSAEAESERSAES